MNMNEMRTFIRLPAVLAATGMSRSSILRAVKAGSFPAPIQIGPHAVAWNQADVAAWQDECIRKNELASACTKTKGE